MRLNWKIKAALVVAANVLWSSATVYAQDPASASAIRDSVVLRFAQPNVNDEVPDFQQHVVPLLGKLGCNGRACHGSFQGRGGFRLSLFGYDFDADHDEIHGRIDPEVPADSILLQKSLMQIQHEGGQRMKEEAGNITCCCDGLKVERTVPQKHR
jgi:hypothetical protein